MNFMIIICLSVATWNSHNDHFPLREAVLMLVSYFVFYASVEGKLGLTLLFSANN